MVRLASYKHVKPVTDLDGLGAWIIRKESKGPYSHNELVIDEWCYSSSIPDGGVRRKQTSLVLAHQEHWDVIELPWADEKFIIDFFQKTDGYLYGFGDIIVQYWLHFDFEFRGDFCCQWCAKALQMPRPGRYNPVTFHKDCKMRNNENI